MIAPAADEAPTSFEAGGTRYRARPARPADLRDLVRLLMTDTVGSAREDARDLAPYEQALGEIDRDPAQSLIVIEDLRGRIVATMQLTVIPGLAHRGARRLNVEAVRVDADLRGQGLGSAMMRIAIGHGEQRGCAIVQLTSDKQRVDAHRFYERLGFQPTHEGFKLRLPPAAS